MSETMNRGPKGPCATYAMAEGGGVDRRVLVLNEYLERLKTRGWRVYDMRTLHYVEARLERDDGWWILIHMPDARYPEDVIFMVRHRYFNDVGAMLSFRREYTRSGVRFDVVYEHEMKRVDGNAVDKIRGDLAKMEELFKTLTREVEHILNMVEEVVTCMGQGSHEAD